MSTPKPAKTPAKPSTKQKIQDLLEEIKAAQKGKKTPKYRPPTQLTLF